MDNFNHGRFRQQVNFLQRQFLPEGDLPFTDVLSKQIVSQALTASKVVWNNSIYSPLVTLWVFLSQVLSEDHSCRSAVARLIGYSCQSGRWNSLHSICVPPTAVLPEFSVGNRDDNLPSLWASEF